MTRKPIPLTGPSPASAAYVAPNDIESSAPCGVLRIVDALADAGYSRAAAAVRIAAEAAEEKEMLESRIEAFEEEVQELTNSNDRLIDDHKERVGELMDRITALGSEVRMLEARLAIAERLLEK